MKCAATLLGLQLSAALRQPVLAHAGHVPLYFFVPIVLVAAFIAWQAVRG